MENRDDKARSSVRISVRFNQVEDPDRDVDLLLPNLEPSYSESNRNPSRGIPIRNNPIVREHKERRKYRFVHPNSHKSALFVNLGDVDKQGNNIRNKSPCRRRDNLFVSPDLNLVQSSSPGSPSSPLQQDKFDAYSGPPLPPRDLKLEDINYTDMNGCFIPCVKQTRLNDVDNVCLDATSGSAETDCLDSNLETLRLESSSPLISDTLATNDNDSDISEIQDYYIVDNDNFVDETIERPDNLDYCIIDDDALRDLDDDLVVNLERELQYYVGIEGLNFDESCRHIQDEINFLEDRLAELERERLKGQSRIAVEEIIRQRRSIRDIDMEILKEKIRMKSKRKLGSIDTGCASPGTFSSPMRPGFENTADILDAVPPPGQFQHCDIMARAIRR